MGKNKRSDKLKGAGDKRHKGANLEVTLREDLAKASGVVQPSAPRAAKQRARAGSDEDLDEKQTASIQEMAKAQRGEEARREADDLAARASRVAFDVEEVSDDDDDDDYLDGDEGDDVDESAFDIGSEALSASLRWYSSFDMVVDMVTPSPFHTALSAAPLLCVHPSCASARSPCQGTTAAPCDAPRLYPSADSSPASTRPASP